jgi:hypothetical protein
MEFAKDNFSINEIDTSFEISKRQTLNLKQVKKQILKNNLSKFVVDISINGYSSKENFDFEIEGEKWSDVKHNFKKHKEAQTDAGALTVKRAIRVLADVTEHYIETHNVVPALNKYNTDNLNLKYCHLGAQYIIPEEKSELLLTLWKNFDKSKNQNMSESIYKILSYRFPEKYK